MTCNSWFSLLSRFDSVIIENDHKFRSFDFEKINIKYLVGSVRGLLKSVPESIPYLMSDVHDS